jgi:hypothetical protein
MEKTNKRIKKKPKMTVGTSKEMLSRKGGCLHHSILLEHVSLLVAAVLCAHDFRRQPTGITWSTDFDDLGSSASRAIQLVNKLRAVGAESDIDIPRIAFAGKQSAGKSSLVEALTGIQLPRSHGTCTRCPIEVTTTRIETHEPWSCTIKLRFLYDDKTNVRAHREG